MASKKELGAAFGVGVLARSPAARKAAVAAVRSGARALGPWGIAALLAYEGVVRRKQIVQVAQEVAQMMPEGGMTGAIPPYMPNFAAPPNPTNLFNPGIGFTPTGPWGYPGMPSTDIMPVFTQGQTAPGIIQGVRKRAKSKFNKAVSKAVVALSKGRGRIVNPSKRFAQAAKIASKANPVTKSRIGKGRSFAQKTARKIRKSVWGVTKRFKK